MCQDVHDLHCKYTQRWHQMYAVRSWTLHSVTKVQLPSTATLCSVLVYERSIDCKTCREGAWPSRISDTFKKDPFFAEAEKWADFDRGLRGKSPTPVKPRISPPRDWEVAYDADGKGHRPRTLYLRQPST